MSPTFSVHLQLAIMSWCTAIGLDNREYYSCPENLAEGQLRLFNKYRSDCLTPFCYASMETEACGGTSIFLPDEPPQCGTPICTQRPAKITLEVKP